MTREEFVKAVRTEALDTAVHDTIMDLQDPPGKKMEAAVMAANQWYQALDPESRTFVEKVARMAAESAAFGVLAILDGVRAIEGDSEKGELILEYRKGSMRLLINDLNQKLLHDMLANWFDVPANPQSMPVDLHHIPESSSMIRFDPSYDRDNATVIALPTREHKNVSGRTEETSKTAPEQLSRDLQDLRDYTQVPDSVIQKLASEIKF